MNILRLTTPAAIPCRHMFSALRKFSSVGFFLALLLTLGVARAEGPDDDYLTIYGLINQADALSASGKTSEAHAKYIAAQRALATFQKDNATYNPKMVSFRLNFLAQKVAATADKTVAPEKAGAPATASSKPLAHAAAKSPVKLLAAGAEPRTVLRLHPALGDKQTVSMTVKMGMVMSVAGKSMPAMDIPAMLLTLDVAVTNISETGEITYEMLFNDATVVTNANTAPAMATTLASSLAKLHGISGTGWMSDRGIIKGIDMKRPEDADPQLIQTLNQMQDSFGSSSMPLPEEAVGVGAKWEYKTKLKSQGMAIDQTVDYELVSITNDQLTLRSVITQSAAPQKIESPAMPGMKMDLNKFTGAGTGDTTYELTHVMPVTGTMDEKTAINMGMNVGQQKQVMDMKMDLQIKFEAK